MKTPDPTNKAESSAPNMRKFIGTFPIRHNTVTAEVLCHLCNGENLTGMDAVFSANTTRLAAVIYYLEQEYGWSIDRVDIDVGTNDGRVATIRAYYLPRATIRRAFDAGALEFCRSVKDARVKRRKHAPKAKAEADKRNAARAAARFNPHQDSLLSGQNPNKINWLASGSGCVL